MSSKITRFLLNVPVNNNYTGEPDLMIETEAIDNEGTIDIDFKNITTDMVLFVKCWHCLYKHAQGVARERFERNAPDEDFDNFWILEEAFNAVDNKGKLIFNTENE